MDLFSKILFPISTVFAWAAMLAALSRPMGVTGPRGASLNWVEALLAAFLGLVIYTGWLAVVLASGGWFSLGRLAAGQIVLALLLFGFSRKHLVPKFHSPTRYEWLLVLLLLLCSLVYFRPHEYILGGTDAGTYVNMSAAISRTGSLIQNETWTRFLSDYGSITLRQYPSSEAAPLRMQFVGWNIDSTDPARVIPQFFPFHPVLLAVGFSLFGVYGALYLTPLWGVLGIGAVYLLGKRLSGPPLGLLAAFLLAITPVQIYFSRYPTTEPLTLLLVLFGLWAFQTLRDESPASPAWGLLGGAALGAALLTRIDLPLMIGLVLLTLGAIRRQGHWSRGWTVFAAAFLFFLAHFLIHGFFFDRPYFLGTYFGVFRMVTDSASGRVIIMLFAAAAVFSGWWLGRKKNQQFQNLFSSTYFRWGLILLASGLSGYAYFLRPYFEPTLHYTSWPSGVTVPVMEAQNWIRLGWYLTPLGLGLSTLGFALIASRESLNRWFLFLTLGSFTTVQYVYKIMIPPYHIYAMRRYLPIVIPTLIIFSALAVLYFLSRKQKIWMRSIGALFLIVLTGGLLVQSFPVFLQRDFPGMAEQITALHRQLKDQAILLISEPSEDYFSDKWGPPLKYIFGHDVATIRREGPDLKPFLEQLWASARSGKKPVQIMAVDPILPAVANNLSLKPAGIFPVTLTSLQNTFDQYPSVVEKAHLEIEIYDVEGTASPSPVFLKAGRVDIGRFDTPFLLKGFHGKEIVPGFPTMRWTRDEASLQVPGGDSRPVALSLRALSFRPSTLPGGEVTVFLDGRFVGRFFPEGKWEIFTFQGHSFPRQGRSLVEFKTRSFNPARSKTGSDRRDLGFLLDWVEISKPAE